MLGYLVPRHDEGVLLFDTGLGLADAETEAHYRPRRRNLVDALAAAALTPSDISMVVNCHLHFDHCGGNALFAGRPILVQSVELAAARGPGYTVPELVDFPGASYRELIGEAEIWPGVWLLPTPGHTNGHQSLVVRQPDGTVVLAGQAHDFASAFGSDQCRTPGRRPAAPTPAAGVPVVAGPALDSGPASGAVRPRRLVWEPADQLASEEQAR